MKKSWCTVRLAQTKGWRPAIIFFQSDNTMKGLALFDSRTNADAFRVHLQSLVSCDLEVVQLGSEACTVGAYIDAVMRCGMSEAAALSRFPVYVNPTDCYCKNVNPEYSSLRKFIIASMTSSALSGVAWVTPMAKIENYNGFTFCVIEAAEPGKKDSKYYVVGIKGTYSNREELVVAIDDAEGTTDDRYKIVFGLCPSVDDACIQARKVIDTTFKK